MKIVADNRGRIALSKLNNKKFSGEVIPWNAPGSEWDVRIEGGEVRITPWNDEPKPEWVKVDNLKPEHVGQVIGVAWTSLGLEGRSITYGVVRPGLYGVLEWYLTGQLGHDVVRVKIAGHDEVDFKPFGQFYVKNV